MWETAKQTKRGFFSACWSVNYPLKVCPPIAARIHLDRLRSRCPGASQMMYLGQQYRALRTIFSEESRLAGCSVPSAHTGTELEKSHSSVQNACSQCPIFMINRHHTHPTRDTAPFARFPCLCVQKDLPLLLTTYSVEKCNLSYRDNNKVISLSGGKGQLIFPKNGNRNVYTCRKSRKDTRLNNKSWNKHLPSN